jgi:hypothetical protein
MSIPELLMSTAAVLPAIEIPDITPDMDGPGVGAALRIVNVLAGILTVILVGGILVSGLLLAFGGLSPQGRTKAFYALGLTALGAAIFGSATALMTFFVGIPLA